MMLIALVKVRDKDGSNHSSGSSAAVVAYVAVEVSKHASKAAVRHAAATGLPSLTEENPSKNLTGPKKQTKIRKRSN